MKDQLRREMCDLVITPEGITGANSTHFEDLDLGDVLCCFHEILVLQITLRYFAWLSTEISCLFIVK
jgi:hypothetical protein